MEHCPSKELFDIISERSSTTGQFNEKEAAEIIQKLLKAINHCHINKITHRDLKPENIMIGRDGELKIIDFGLAAHVKPTSQLDSVVGSPFYLAPEVLLGKYGSKCDIWSLGVLLYILLSGYLPFVGKTPA